MSPRRALYDAIRAAEAAEVAADTTAAAVESGGGEGGYKWWSPRRFLMGVVFDGYHGLPDYQGTGVAYRITRETPAMILYGKEMRLPALPGTEEPPPPTLLSTEPTGPLKSASFNPTPAEYAVRLHNRIVYAWKVAYGATRSAQAEIVANTTSCLAHE